MKAINSYQLCLNLLAGDTTVSSRAMLVAASNNVSHVYYKLDDYQAFRDTLEDLESQAAQLASQNISPPTAFEARRFEEFFLNITLAQEPMTAPSA